jgi:hypothetical protein
MYSTFLSKKQKHHDFHYSAYAWLRLQVTNSLTGVERYKSDTICIELDRSINEPGGGVAMNDNEQSKREFTDEERRWLVDYFGLLIEIDQQEKARYAILKDDPIDYRFYPSRLDPENQN